jgi:hypothetical protein
VGDSVMCQCQCARAAGSRWARQAAPLWAPASLLLHQPESSVSGHELAHSVTEDQTGPDLPSLSRERGLDNVSVRDAPGRAFPVGAAARIPEPGGVGCAKCRYERADPGGGRSRSVQVLSLLCTPTEKSCPFCVQVMKVDCGLYSYHEHVSSLSKDNMPYGCMVVSR